MGRIRYDFTGEVAVVTGAASGIGRAVLDALAAAGAHTHGFDLQAPPLGPEARGSRSCAPRWHAVDVRSTSSVERGVAAVMAAEGQVDLVVNNAGIARDAVLWKLRDPEWQEVLETNLSGAWRVLRAVVPHMRQRSRGRIVQIASINGLRGRFGQANYSASKAGLIGLTRTAARELGPRGITVNAVAPGLIETSMASALSSGHRQRAVDETATGRLGTVDDVAAAVLFLLSDDAAHITGDVLRVDGGQSC